MSLLNGIHSYGSTCYVYLSTPKEVYALSKALRDAGIKVYNLIKKSNHIVGLSAKMSESTAELHIKGIKN